MSSQPSQTNAIVSLAPPSKVDIRSQLELLVSRDLLGPFGGDAEELDESRVTDRYLVGMLAPANQELGADQDDGLETGGSVDSEDGKAEKANTRGDALFPSSMGFTFAVDNKQQSVRVHSQWGLYTRKDSETLLTDAGQPQKVWKRQAMGGTVDIGLAPGPIKTVVPDSRQSKVRIEGLVRDRDGEKIVTLFLVNKQPRPESRPDEAWLFQAEMSVEDPDGQAIFRRRPQIRNSTRMAPTLYAEEQELAMLYRRDQEFAVGHGIAVGWETAEGDPWRAHRLKTCAIPSYEIEQQTQPSPADPGFERLGDAVFEMDKLANTRPDELPGMLAPLVQAYAEWIERLESRKNDKSERLDEYGEAPKRVIERCRHALERIQEGIDLLRSDSTAAEAFLFANRAMWQQRVRSLYAERKRRREEVTLESIDADPRNRSWYPFQLAFILLNLPSVTKLDHPDRSHPTDAIADLLWFPTGGGKTEAYLGLTAYVMAMRRLQGVIEGRPGQNGVAVIMRYTLRLLTLQQFQRASALICAAEVIRRGNEAIWGTEPFRIGLWVGAKATPNWTSQSEEAIREAKGNKNSWTQGSTSGTPAQLTNCPWCGSPIKPDRDIIVESVAGGRGRTFIYCGDSLGRCSFSKRQSPEGLPVLVVDEEIYRQLPSLLIATVDKFAQMPWNGRTQMLFGRLSGLCPRHGFVSPEVDDEKSHRKRGELPAVSVIPYPPVRPPDLIIQDELHLISGPLGSLVGLYETAVEELCTWQVNGKRIRPKVVASTATIRNAGTQIQQLFCRRVQVFPPSGLDVSDNFFSIRRSPAIKSGRRYLGICAPGRRLKAALIRVYIAYMSGSQMLYDKHGRSVDPWMTLVGYFNSLRELGGMRRLVDDDVQNRLRQMETRGLAKRLSPKVEELTSRKSSTDIPRVLDLLEMPFDPHADKERDEARKRGEIPAPKPIDVLLATNMISVGVDIKRFGLMVMAGQPKSTSEYIQATSRIGRSEPGIVCTVYNWARPRDLSHYERFRHYHATFYEQVESISVTPFAARALDRGLTALLVSLIRLPLEEYNPNDAAVRIRSDHPQVATAIEAIVTRVQNVMNSKSSGDVVRDELKSRLDAWLYQAQRTPTLGYKSKRDGVTVPLLRMPEEDEWGTFTCLNSLRDVEPSAAFVLTEDATSR